VFTAGVKQILAKKERVGKEKEKREREKKKQITE
jgi:hypothetical protein